MSARPSAEDFPDQDEALPAGSAIQQAKIALKAGEIEEAERICLAALRADSRDVDALRMLSTIRVQQKRPDEALILVLAALTIRPDHRQLLLEHAGILEKLRSPERAEAAYAHALSTFEAALKKSTPQFKDLMAQGEALRALNRSQEALTSFSQACVLKPNSAFGLSQCGNVLLDLGRTSDAITYFDEALKIKPGYADAHFPKGLGHLRIGEFEEGWRHHEWRWDVSKFGANNALGRFGHTRPFWNGDYVNGTLLAWSEQGLGEEVLFAGMLPDLARYADEIILEVSERLVGLFSRSFPECTVMPWSKVPEGIAAANIPFGSMGTHLRKNWDDFPRREQGYLVPDPVLTGALRTRLHADERKVIGVTWRSFGAVLGRFKSTTLRDLEPILRLPNCRFVDLQYGDTSSERAAVEQELGVKVERLADIDNTEDLDGLAALMSACDAVVAVSGVNAHLAGAVGCPVWVLVPAGRGKLWFWFHQGDVSPWYSRVRVCRQSVNGNWQDVIVRIASDLATFLKS